MSKYYAYICQKLFQQCSDPNISGRQVFYLHGKQSTSEQLKSYEEFISSENGVLFTTDIASRGLDISSLNYVVQLDLPKMIDTFIHRAGRVARNGKQGVCITFVTKNEEGAIKILRNKGMCIKQGDINQDMKDVNFNNEILDQKLSWSEKCPQNLQIQFHKKQLKKFENEKEKLRNKGVSEEIIYKKYNKAEQQVKQILNQELKQEEEQFQYEKQIYDTKIAKFLRNLQINDRFVLDLCQQAFISYVRAYKEYELQILLNLKTIRLGCFAMSLGMLSLPKVAELQGIYINFQKFDGDLTKIKYQDEKLEQKHQKNIELKHQRVLEQETQIQEQQNNQDQQQDQTQQTQFDKEKYKKSLQLSKRTQQDLQKEIDLLTKLKSKEITEEEFEKEIDKLYQ